MSPSIRETPVNTQGKTLHCKLRMIMGEKNNMRIQDLCNLTGLRRNTISGLYNDKVTRIDTITLTAICAALECQPGDLLEIVPEEQQNRPSE